MLSLAALEGGAAGVTVQDISTADALVVINNLWNSTVTFGDPVTNFDDIGGAGYAVILLVCFIPRSITTKYESLHNVSLSRTRWLVH